MIAFQTELTLTNKAISSSDKQTDVANSDADGSNNTTLDSFLFKGVWVSELFKLSFYSKTDLPSEDQLSKFSLFPEIHKLYGHGYIINKFTFINKSNLRV